MRRICLIFVAVILLAETVSIGAAAEGDDPASDPLSDYLHANHLPLVEARTIVNASGERSVLLYGYVATDFGKRDAEDQTNDFMDDPDITIINRIVVRPELLTIATPGNSNSSADGIEPAADSAAADGQEEATAVNYPDFRDQFGNGQDYANQERNDEFMMGNGTTFGGVPLILAILGSGAIVPPLIASPMAFGPTYSPRFSPSVNPAFNPRIGSPAPPVIIVNTFNPGFGAPARFTRPLGSGYFPSLFPAAPSPTFPATGGTPPFPSIGHGFGGFAGRAFASGFAGGGFHGGFGGGHR
jgi:hypothetical protein